MAQGRQLFLLSAIAIVFLMILSRCYSYPLFNEVLVSQRPTKFHSPNEVDRYVDRMKQYYETMAQLRYWRRDIDESDDGSDDTLQNILQQYKHLQHKR